MDTKKLRQKILDLAIRGKLVPQDPNDEPASVLLERIRAEKEQLIKEGIIKRTKKSNASDTSHYENVPFEVPEGWCWVRVYDISSAIIYGVSESAKSEGKYKLLRITDIQNNKVNWNTVPLTDYPEEKAASYTLRTGDILFARTGATVGKSYLVDNSVPENSIYASYLIRVQVSSIINSNYVKYFFESGFYWNQIADNSVGVGQPNVNGTSLGNLWLPIPPIQEQERIVEKLNSWCTIIDEIKVTQESIRATISDLRSRILEYAISGKLVPQDCSDESAIELLKRINPMFSPADNRHYENIPFELPETWLWVTLSDISNYGECANVSIDKISNESWVLELEDIEKDSGRLLQRMRKSDRTINGVRHSFQKGDVLYSKLRTYLNKVLVADQDGYCTTEIIPITCVQGIVPEYLCHVLRSKYYVDYTISLGYGVKMPRLGTGDALKSMIPVPPYEEQRRIVKSVNEIYHKLEQISSEL